MHLKAKSILNLGCGTGKHDYLLAERGYNVTGIDLSEAMIGVAMNKLDTCTITNKPIFQQGDIRSVKLEKKFEVVISLFHVMSYQTSNEDLEQSLRTAFEHLEDGGVFIFDCWYGPGHINRSPAL